MIFTASMMSLARTHGHRRRRLFERTTAVAISLAVEALLLTSLAYRPIELGVHEGGPVNVSLLQLETPAIMPSAAAVEPPKVAAALRAESKPESKPASSRTGVAVGEVVAPLDEPLGQPEPDAAPAQIVDSATEEAAMASITALVAQAVAAEAGQPGESCKIAEWLTGALRDSEEIAAAVALVPRKSRSVANALMLWNGLWVEPPLSARAGVGYLKYAVLAGVRTAPLPCLEQTVRGPLLIPVGDRGDTLLLAIGSGEWRWGDLLIEQELQGAAAPQS